mgnify:CR=1 FL=1|jgi:hypothetical protein
MLPSNTSRSRSNPRRQTNYLSHSWSQVATNRHNSVLLWVTLSQQLTTLPKRSDKHQNPTSWATKRSLNFQSKSLRSFRPQVFYNLKHANHKWHSDQKLQSPQLTCTHRSNLTLTPHMWNHQSITSLTSSLLSFTKVLRTFKQIWIREEAALNSDNLPPWIIRQVPSKSLRIRRAPLHSTPLLQRYQNLSCLVHSTNIL